MPLERSAVDADILTLDEASDILGCSSQTVRVRILDGLLPVVRKLPGPNGAYLVLRSDVEKLLEDKSV